MCWVSKGRREKGNRGGEADKTNKSSKNSIALGSWISYTIYEIKGSRAEQDLRSFRFVWQLLSILSLFIYERFIHNLRLSWFFMVCVCVSSKFGEPCQWKGIKNGNKNVNNKFICFVFFSSFNHQFKCY